MTKSTASSSSLNLSGFQVSEKRAAAWEGLELDETSFERPEAFGTHDAEALAALRALSGELAEHISTCGTAGGLVSFVGAADSFAAAADRLAVITTTELVECARRTNGERRRLTALCWPDGLSDPDDPFRHRRVLCALESPLVRVAALTKSHVTAVEIALGEVGATANELGHVTATDVDLGTFTVGLPGGERLDAREVTAPVWASASLRVIVEEFLERGLETVPMLYCGQSTDPETIRPAIEMSVKSVLRRAGFAGADSKVTFDSVRATGARHVVDAGGHVGEAAELLGLDSLEKTRVRIGLKPTPAPSPRS